VAIANRPSRDKRVRTIKKSGEIEHGLTEVAHAGKQRSRNYRGEGEKGKNAEHGSLLPGRSVVGGTKTVDRALQSSKSRILEGEEKGTRLEEEKPN